MQDKLTKDDYLVAKLKGDLRTMFSDPTMREIHDIYTSNYVQCGHVLNDSLRKEIIEAVLNDVKEKEAGKPGIIERLTKRKIYEKSVRSETFEEWKERHDPTH